VRIHNKLLSISITARPNLSYIVHFGPYCPHDFVHGDASPHLSLTPQNAYDKLATSTCYILSALGFTALTVLFLATRTHIWAWRPKKRMTSWQPALIISPTTTPSPADVGYYNPHTLRSLTTPSAQPDKQWGRFWYQMWQPRPTCHILFALGLTALTVLFLMIRVHIWAWCPKTRMTCWQPALLIRPAITPSPADVGYYN